MEDVIHVILTVMFVKILIKNVLLVELDILSNMIMINSVKLVHLTVKLAPENQITLSNVMFVLIHTTLKKIKLAQLVQVVKTVRLVMLILA